MNKTTFIYLFLGLFFCSCGGKKQNNLSKASSPYLKEHANNPVDWYEWGDEALQAAKKEDKPLLISIGYSSCHWCHMMEKESFMDTAVARIMNENFVCIKVDREERPDIDNVYSNACQLITGGSGWPLNAFALPDGKPFFAGTYYSKKSWQSLLMQIAQAYRTQKGKVDLQAQSISNGIATQELSVLTDSVSTVADSVSVAGKMGYQRFFEDLYQRIDLSNGGLKGTPKFPIPSSLAFLLQYYSLTGDKRALDAADTTLTKMALGGIYDQIGGGFARYAIDSSWHIPHFEKMLYDNARLLSVYAHAYQLTRNAFFKDILQETIGFVQRDLGNPGGGYYTAVNADTREGEGAFYAWTSAGLQKSLLNDYRPLALYYHISEEGNWMANKNILFASETPDRFAQKNHIPPYGFSRQLASAKQALLSERNKRDKPTVDDKILTSWNALLITGYLDAYAALGNESYLQDALRTALFLERTMIREDGKLSRLFKDGKATVNGLLDDYAHLAKAYIRLYELTFDKHWLDRAHQLTDYTIKNFYSPGNGMFCYTAYRTDSAVIQKTEIADNDLPSSNAVMAEVLYRLGVYFDDEDYLKKSTRMLARVYGQLCKGGTHYYASWCSLAGWFAYGAGEVAIMGRDALVKNLELQKNYLPLYIFMGSTAEENLPLLVGKKGDIQTRIYICINKACRRPVGSTADALAQLKDPQSK